jgi:hypothetical protein
VALQSQKTSPVAPLSQKTSPVAPLSQWLQLMLAEITRKREDLEHARAETAHRSAENAAPPTRA